jgi:tetratricopeptide (TPR) repeat protein
MMLSGTSLLGQRNCNVFLWEGDSCRYEACIYLEQAPAYFQLLREFHEIMDKAIEICPEYSDAYRAKSVAYLKTGDFVQWYQIISKAVEIKPEDHLDYRGWCRFQFFRDYPGAIADLEHLKEMVGGDIGYSQNGMYHLEIARALCYKMMGEREKALHIIEKQMETDSSSIGFYDYLHLGVLYLESAQYEKAVEALSSQMEINPIGEGLYYLALSYKELGKMELYKNSLKEAQQLYKKGSMMRDVYTHQVDKVYLKTIEKEIAESQNL